MNVYFDGEFQRYALATGQGQAEQESGEEATRSPPPSAKRMRTSTSCNTRLPDGSDILSSINTDMGARQRDSTRVLDDANVNVWFVVEGHTIGAHREVLRQCASEALQLNMAHATSDVLGGRIQIYDVSFPIFRALLQYLYTATGPADDSGEGAQRMDAESTAHLLLVAERYMVWPLQHLCVEPLRDGPLCPTSRRDEAPLHERCVRELARDARDAIRKQRRVFQN